MPELALPPLDENLLDSADAVVERRAQVLRAALLVVEGAGFSRPQPLTILNRGEA